MNATHQIHEWLEATVQQLVFTYRTKLREQEPDTSIAYTVNGFGEWEVGFSSSGFSNSLSLRCRVQLTTEGEGRALTVWAYPSITSMGAAEVICRRQRLFLDLLEDFDNACASYQLPNP
jgi:hypothetical protein